MEQNNELSLETVGANAWQKALSKRGRANILIAGKTGVGKSTLVNTIFQQDLATTGSGRPVTQGTTEYTKSDLPVTLLDTRGLEMKDYQSIVDDLHTEIKQRGNSTDPNDHIHLAWLCVDESSRRIEDGYTYLTESISDSVPIIGVITKARQDIVDEVSFRQTVKDLLPKLKNVIRVRCLTEELDDGYCLNPMGLEELVNLSIEVLPEGQRMAFAAAQRVSLNQKKKQAHIIVAGSATAAAAAGATPIPFADSVILIPIQVGMLAGISAAFGLELSKGFLATLVSSFIGTSAATLGGRAIVTGLLKLFPGVGSVAGGVIAGSTAAALTTAMGETYIKVLSSLADQGISETITLEELQSAIKDRIKEV